MTCHSERSEESARKRVQIQSYMESRALLARAPVHLAGRKSRSLVASAPRDDNSFAQDDNWESTGNDCMTKSGFRYAAAGVRRATTLLAIASLPSLAACARSHLARGDIDSAPVTPNRLTRAERDTTDFYC